MNTFEFSGVLGGKNSQLGFFALGYSSGDYQYVRWIQMKTEDLNAVKQFFGADEGGHPVFILRGETGTVTLHRDQVQKAVENGAVVQVIYPAGT